MKSVYKAIKGIGTGRGGLRVGVRQALYEGPDHLLVVSSSGYTEEYKRVFYRDVRYVVARKSHRQTFFDVFFAIGLLFGVVFFIEGHWGIGSVVVALFVLGFVVNYQRGPTCHVVVNTEVQTLELPAPYRFAKMPLLVALINSRLDPGQAPVESTLPAAS